MPFLPREAFLALLRAFFGNEFSASKVPLSVLEREGLRRIDSSAHRDDRGNEVRRHP